MTSDQNYLALDIGEARIGVAVGSVVPFGRGTLDSKEPQTVLARLKEVIAAENITSVVIGIPEVASGDVTPIAELALLWADAIRTNFHLPVITVNEAYTSLAAERQLRAEGVDTKSFKHKIDERSAQLILSQYLAERGQA